MHEHLIDREAMKPGGEGRFTPKTPDFSKELNEDLLSEIFRFRHISRHPQAEGVNSPIMTLVELLKGTHVALGRSLRQRIVSGLWCLSFGCSHVFVCSSSRKKL
jgi:hypothetical protein